MDKLTLNDTIKWMTSDDFRDRLVAEYVQTRIRYNKLIDNLVDKHVDGLTVFNTINLRQLEFMYDYLDTLIFRIQTLGIDLTTYNIDETQWRY